MKEEELKIGQTVYVQGIWKGILKEINPVTYGVLVIEGIGWHKPTLYHYQKHLIKSENLRRN